MRRHRVTAAVAALAVVALPALLGAGCGGGTAASGGPDLIVVKMSAMRFEPSSITVHVNDTVTFRFVNTDTVTHEAVIGDADYQRRHAQMMDAMAPVTTMTTVAPEHGRARAAVSHPGMNDPNAIEVPPGSTAEIKFTFGKVTQMLIGCHEPGHYDAGMKAIIDVVA